MARIALCLASGTLCILMAAGTIALAPGTTFGSTIYRAAQGTIALLGAPMGRLCT